MAPDISPGVTDHGAKIANLSPDVQSHCAIGSKTPIMGRAPSRGAARAWSAARAHMWHTDANP
jgi:hypothetical protein